MLSLLPLLFVAIAVSAHAGVYKCANDKGGVTYQDTACAPGRELRDLERDPATVSVIPLLPSPADKTPPTSAKPPRAPSGMATVSSASAAERKFLQVGMSEAEVIQKVGRPDVESEGRAKGGGRWSYLPTAGDSDTLTTLTFSGGKIAHVERKAVR